MPVALNTAKNWLSILQGSFQVFLLQPYHSNLTKRLVKRPKLYFLDSGLCAYLSEWSSPETLEAGAMSGAIFETYVFAEILKSWWHRGKHPNIYYFRNRDAEEVDLLFDLNGKIYPIEIKKSVTPKRAWANTFSVLDELKQKIGEGAVICLCKEILPIDRSVQAMPVGMI